MKTLQSLTPIIAIVALGFSVNAYFKTLDMEAKVTLNDKNVTDIITSLQSREFIVYVAQGLQRLAQ